MKFIITNTTGFYDECFKSFILENFEKYEIMLDDYGLNNLGYLIEISTLQQLEDLKVKAIKHFKLNESNGVFVWGVLTKEDDTTKYDGYNYLEIYDNCRND